MSMLIRQFLHHLRLLKWHFRPKKTALDFYGESIKSIAGRWESELEPVTTYQGLFDVLRQKSFTGNLLELGGGYSTILAKTIFDSNDVEVISIDAYPEKYYRILNSKKNTKRFLNTITAINEITVSLEQVKKALPIIVNRLISFEPSSVKNALGLFIKDKNILDVMCGYVDAKDSQKICDIYLGHHGFQNDILFYEEFNALTGDWACKKISDEKMIIDALFLDCGEASSLAEFIALEGNLKSGCYLLLHDIYHPKSIKNFLLATLLTVDNSWEIIYVDSVSKQGALVARLL